ncbi:MAG: SpoIIE family protein phosphatase, partial [Anaerolineae bacterium]|nr:SpoIIE family protein phosphatase [Anaerolineae bacterium]
QAVVRVARGMAQDTIQDPEFQISRGVVERVLREGRALLTSDAQSDDRLSLRTSIHALGLRSILCAPLKAKDHTIGAIYVDNRLHAGIFLPDDLELLTAIASSAAIAIENARLYEVAVEKGRMERELQMARSVQASLLPRSTPQVPGWEIAARWRPARQVAGDYYDFLTGSGPEAGIVIADVSGKGMPAALFMALTRSIVRASLSLSSDLAGDIGRANRLISADAAEDGTFVTLFYACLASGTGDVSYVNAGHNPPLLVKKHPMGQESAVVELAPTGMALGILDSARFEQRRVHMEPGDLLLLYTDGVTDAFRDGTERFGLHRLRRAVMGLRGEPAEGVVAALETEVLQFAGTDQQFDDMAILAARRVGQGRK